MLNVKQKMLIARMMNRALRLVRCLAVQGMRTRCKRKGVEWDLDLDEGIDLSIYLLGAYEPSVLRAYSAVIRPGDVVFDIGANIGAHTLHFAKLVGPTGRVFAFEPTDYATAKILKNLAINPELALRVNFQQRFLVADSTDVLPASIAARWPVANEHDDLNDDHLGKPESLVHAQAITADDFCAAEHLLRLDFVKIDVDGHEFPVLRGFRRSLERFRPNVLIELAPFVYKDARTSEFDNFVRFFADLDYNFTDSRTGRPIPRDPEVLRRHITPGGSVNCLLYPSARKVANPPTVLARVAEVLNNSPLWHCEHRVWGQRMASSSLDRWLYLRLHCVGRIGATEKRTLERIVRPGMKVLDVGANLGLYSVLLSRLVGPSGSVISFEPDPHLFTLLSENCARNGCTNVETHNLALGRGRDRLVLQKEILNSGNNFLGASSRRHLYSEVEVDVVSIDDFLPSLRPDLVKIDVQGWEVEVLCGMQRMLAASPHIALYVEFWPEGLRRAGHSSEEFIDFLASQHFQVYLTDNSGNTLLDRADLAALTLRLSRSKYADLYAAR